MSDQARLGSVICVCGPTASGKSRLADKLAHKLSSSVISVDAMQVYRGMDIGTAKMPISERSAPLLMVDVVNPNEEFSVADYQRLSRQEIDKLLEQGKTPVLCGGTGLYLDSIIDDMEFPKGSRLSEKRKEYEQYAKDKGAEALFELLYERDSESAQLIHVHNTRRIIRALELHDLGKSYAKRTKEGLKAHKPYYNYHMWAIVVERSQLYARIEKRVDEMFAQGLVEEVEQLEQTYKLSQSPTASQAIGYKEVLSYLSGTVSLDEAKLLVKRATKRYAKRQLSWISRDGRAHELNLSKLSEAEALELMCSAVSAQKRSEQELNGSK